jgi:exonuclease SbcD
MKIIHFADLHLGVETYGRPDADSGLNTRFLDFLAAFDKLVTYAVAEKVDLVLFCGDAFKSRDPSQTQQREFARRIRQLADNNIPVFLLIGNHDLPAASGRATSTEIYDTLRISRVTVAAKPGIYRIATASGDIQIAALPWPRKGALEVKAQNDDRPLSAESLKAGIEAILSAKVERMAAELDPSLPAVLAAHIWVDGARLGSEKSLVLGNEPTVMLGNIASPKFDYVALGHLHKRQVLNETPPVVYAGGLERLDFGEEKDDKGFYEVELTTVSAIKKVNYRFHRLDGRRFLTLEKTLGADCLDPTAEVLALIEANRELIMNSVVQLKLRLPESIAPVLRELDIKSALKGAHYFAVSRLIERENRSRYGVAESEALSPRKALEQYLDVQAITGTRRTELLEHADMLLAEVSNS